MLPNQLPPPAASDDMLTRILHMLEEEKRKGNTLMSRVAEGTAFVDQPQMKGEKIFPCMKQLVLMARCEILLMGYRLDGGSDGETDFLDALKMLSQQAKQSDIRIRVRILINRKKGLASFVENEGDNAFRKGIQLDNLDIEYVEHSHQALGSYHTKMLVIDGEIAMMPSGELLHASDYKDGQSRQVDVVSIFYGMEFVRFLRQEFIGSWSASSCLPVRGNKTSIPIELEDSKFPPRVFPAAIQARALYIAKNENGNVGTRNHSSPFALALIKAIREAKHSIYILTPNMNHGAIITALAAAHQKGINIHIVMGKHMNDATENMPLMGGTNQKGIQKLFNEIARRKGDPFKNIQVHWATDDAGRKIIPFPHVNTVHARMVCIDDHIVIVGSSVCDKQSIHHSKEADAILFSREVAQLYMREIFIPIFSKGINIFLDPENIIVVSPTPGSELSKLSLCYELNECKRNAISELNSRWSVLKRRLPGNKVIQIEEMRLRLTQALISDIKVIDDFSLIKSLLSECMKKNRLLTLGIITGESRPYGLEMSIINQEQYGGGVDEAAFIDLGDLQRILVKYTAGEPVHAPAMKM
jgi:phosphatidylserine/phosphatidylglycerophosphate/cardiolipin synthase-like enzyme